MKKLLIEFGVLIFIIIFQEWLISIITRSGVTPKKYVIVGFILIDLIFILTTLKSRKI